MRRMFSEKQLKEKTLEVVNNGIESGVIDLEKSPVKEFSFEISGEGDRTIENSYTKCVICHGLMLIVFNFLVKNETESTISGSNVYLDVELDNDTASKIYDFDGIPVSELNTDSPYQTICYVPFGKGTYASTNGGANLVRYGDSKPKTLRLNVGIDSLSAGATHKISGRSFILLV